MRGVAVAVWGAGASHKSDVVAEGAIADGLHIRTRAVEAEAAVGGFFVSGDFGDLISGGDVIFGDGESGADGEILEAAEN